MREKSTRQVTMHLYTSGELLLVLILYTKMLGSKEDMYCLTSWKALAWKRLEGDLSFP